MAEYQAGAKTLEFKLAPNGRLAVGIVLPVEVAPGQWLRVQEALFVLDAQEQMALKALMGGLVVPNGKLEVLH